MKKIITIFFVFLALSSSATDPFSKGYLKTLMAKTSKMFKVAPKYFATYYIATTGNDVTGDGSIGNPWATLYKATTTVTTGNLIYVNAGTYTETQQSVLATGVSIQGADSATTIIKSTVTADYTEIINMRSLVEGTNGNQSISNIQMDGQNTNNMTDGTTWGIYITCRSNVEIYNCSFKNFRFTGVKWIGADDNDTDNAPTTWATGNVFRNNRVFNCAGYTQLPFSFGHGGLWIAGQDGMLIYDNVMEQKSRPYGENGWPIKAQNWTRGCEVYGNTINKIPLGGTNGDPDWTWGNEWGDVQGLNFHDNTCIGGGVDFNRNTKGIYSYSVWLHDNYIGNLVQNVWRQSAVYLEVNSEDLVIEDNVFENVANGINFTPRVGDTVRRILIQRNAMNLATASGPEGSGTGITMGGDDGYIAQYFNGIEIYNNTIVYKAGQEGNYGISLGKLGSGVSNDYQIKNNILRGCAVTVITEPGGNTVAVTNLVITNNNFYSNGTSAPTFAGGSGSPGTGYVFTDNFTTDPLFVNSATDLHLQAGSPCIGAGTNVGNGIDVGAYQYGADTTAPTVTSTSPINGATGVSVSANVTVTFDENLDPATVTTSSASIGGVTSAVSYSGGVITINPTGNLTANTLYSNHYNSSNRCSRECFGK